MTKLLWMLAFVVGACGGGDEKKTETSGSGSAAKPAEGGSGSATMAGSAGAGGSAAGSGAGSGSAVVEPVALSPKIKAARCGEPCLFLTDTPLAKFVETYKAECAGMKTKELGFEDCKQLDYVRNCIYAAHGLVYKKKKWKIFSTKPWYEPRPAFDAKTISTLERANVHELNVRGKACKKGVNVSGADFEKMKAWFAEADKGKIAAGPYFMVDSEKKTAAELATWFKGEFKDGTNKRKITIEQNAIASYEKMADVPKKLLTAIKAPKGAKLRSIMVDMNDPAVSGDEENPITEGANVRFIFDDKDKLLAVTAAHYLYD